MASYKLNQEAENDIVQLYRYGILNYGLEHANFYYDGLFQSFDNIAENPYLFQTVDHFRMGYRRSVYQSHSIYYYIENDNYANFGSTRCYKFFLKFNNK